MGRTKNDDGQVKRRRRKPKDVNKPKRALTAYFLFLADCRCKAKLAGRNISRIAEFTKECSEEWRSLADNDRRRYEEQAAKDRARYDAEMAQYKGKKCEPGKPKRAKSGYFFFLDDFRVMMKGKNIDHKEILRKAGEVWRGMSEDDKKKYEKKSQEDQKRYEREMVEFRKGGAAAVSKMKAAAEKNGQAEEEEEEDDDDDDEEEDDE
ncbi:high mobility group protein DSP1-like [Liolophura sinensis]|uniref:high mobility group protein DSP1-like n=1 Tax=Liolophura sinensis TaxID=3198878 RepID=UPI0031589FE6